MVQSGVETVSAAFPGRSRMRRSNSPSCNPSIGPASGQVLFPVSVLSTALSAWLSSTSVRPRNFPNPHSHDQTTSTKVLLCLVACDSLKFDVQFHSQSHVQNCVYSQTLGEAPVISASSSQDIRLASQGNIITHPPPSKREYPLDPLRNAEHVVSYRKPHSSLRIHQHYPSLFTI